MTYLEVRYKLIINFKFACQLNQLKLFIQLARLLRFTEIRARDYCII